MQKQTTKTRRMQVDELMADLAGRLNRLHFARRFGDAMDKVHAIEREFGLRIKVEPRLRVRVAV